MQSAERDLLSMREQTPLGGQQLEQNHSYSS